MLIPATTIISWMRVKPMAVQARVARMNLPFLVAGMLRSAACGCKSGRPAAGFHPRAARRRDARHAAGARRAAGPAAYNARLLIAGVAQLVEQLIRNQ